MMTDTAHWQVYGHDWAVAHLRKSLFNARTRHAYLITGAESVGKTTLAQTFAMALNCTADEVAARPCRECRSCRLILSGNHPDLLYSELDENTARLKIEEVRRVTGQLALKPFEARYRIAIFRDFDRAQPTAQDALLKTLEEPSPHAVLLVLARSAESLLPTITSRSQLVPLRPAAAEQVYTILREQFYADDEQAALLAHISGGRIGWALRALSDPEPLEARAAALDQLEQVLQMNRIQRFALAEDLAKDKLALLGLLEQWQTYWRDLVLLAHDSPLDPANYDRREQLALLAGHVSPDDALVALRQTVTLSDQLGSQNLNTRLALEALFLRYPGLHRT